VAVKAVIHQLVVMAVLAVVEAAEQLMLVELQHLGKAIMVEVVALIHLQMMQVEVAVAQAQ
jgi:hypothetical protein